MLALKPETKTIPYYTHSNKNHLAV